MPEPISRKECQDQTVRLAKEAFATHEVRSGSWEDRRWVLKRPDGSGFYWCEIVMINGGVLVHGDISTAVFGYHSGGDDKTVLSWVARGDLGYMAEKFRLGMNDGGKLCWSWDDRVAQHELDRWRKEHEDEKEEMMGYDPEEWERVNDLYEQAQVALNDHRADDFAAAMYHASELTEVGHAISAQVIYAKAAVERLWQLIS